MANNRMVLVCNVCIPKADDWNFNSKGILPITKWYPEAPYYKVSGDTEWVKRFEDFLEEHHHPEVPSEHYGIGAGQENPIRIEYESRGLPVLNNDERNDNRDTNRISETL